MQFFFSSTSRSISSVNNINNFFMKTLLNYTFFKRSWHDLRWNDNLYWLSLLLCDIICTFMCDFWKIFLSNIKMKKIRPNMLYTSIKEYNMYQLNPLHPKQKQKFTERWDLGSTEPYINHSQMTNHRCVYLLKYCIIQEHHYNIMTSGTYLGSHMVKS